MSTATPFTTASLIGPATPRTAGVAAALLRVALGVVMIAHGVQKVFTFGLAGTGEAFAGMGVPLGTVAGPAVALLELIGGVLVLVGAGTRVVAALYALTMVGASLLVHVSSGFFAADGGYEFTFVLAVMSVVVVLLGAGLLSVDGILHRRAGTVR